MVRRLATGAGRLVHALLRIAFATAVLASIAAAGLAWRLAQGPIDLAWAARRIETLVNKPGSPTRLVIADAGVEWEGFAAGPRRGLELQLHGVRVIDRRTGHVASAGRLEMALSTHSLLLGQVVPLSIAASGLELHLVRGPDRTVALDFGGMDLGSSDDGATLTDSVAELARAPRIDQSPASPADQNPAPPALQHLEQLRRVRLDHSVLILDDPVLGANWRLDVGSLDLRRPTGGGVNGTADATLELGAARATLALQAELAPEGGTTVHLQLAPIAAAAVQHEATQQGALDPTDLHGLDAAVQASATLTLDPALLPTDATLHADAGTGTMHVAGGSIGFDSLGLDATAHWTRVLGRPRWTRPTSLALSRARAVLHAPGGAWPTTVDVQGEIHEQDQRLAGTVQASVDHLAFADIPSLWPIRLSGHTRPWITQNITAGTARDGTLKAGFEATPDLTRLVLKTVDASLVGDDVTIWWFRPAPPVEHAQAILTMRSPETLDIAIASARQGPTPLANGAVRITGLNVKDQFLALTADAAGQAVDVINLLKQPRLGLLDRKPIPMRNPGGTFTGHLAVNLPLNEDLRFDQVTIATRAHFAALHLGGLVGGRDLDRGDIQLEATQDSLKASGPATLAGLPSAMTVEMIFTNGGPNQVVQRAQASTTATAKQLATAGFDTGSLMPSGTGQFTAAYTQRRDTSADLQITADLQQASLAIASWHKPPGQPADAHAHLLLRADRLVGLDQIAAHGPGMAIEGRAEMVGDRPLLLVLDRIVLGPTQAHGQIRFTADPREPIRVNLAGPTLDLSSELAKTAGPRPPQATQQGPLWVADLNFDRIIMADNQAIAGVTAHAENDGRRIAALTLATTGPERIQASIRPEANGRHLSVRTEDAGALLHALDVIKTVQGGRLALEAHYDDTRPDPPLAGSAELSNFHVRGVPILGKLLQAVTIYGVVDALSGPGLAFSDLVMPFRYDAGILDVTDARAFSASLGLTARGRIDQNRGTIDLQGTIVPVYVLNSLLGRIPVLGRLFSAERGGGLFAVNYGLHGPIANPQISANPLSALTPGFLRGLFHIMD